MRKVYYFILTTLLCISVADAAVRDATSVTRAATSRSTVSRTASTTQDAPTTSRNLSSRNSERGTTSRSTVPVISRSASPSRTATTATISRSDTSKQTTARTGKTSARSGENGSATAARSARTATAARATVNLLAHDSITFGTGYNTCRDAYFTCMDQFCGTANDTYRRCICSTKLPMIQSRERALSQASDQLNDFTNLNLSVIDKTAAEVNAMVSASTGELTQSYSKDTSASASQLSGISEILSQTKKKSLSTQGTLDIAGDINSIWATTDLAGGANISNLTGEALYNAVHAQCSELVADKCPSAETQNMVVSAYGMYIENDCSLLINNLDKQLLAANSGIRATEREMNIARLDTYNSHNSSDIHECIAQVRQDITASNACGTDYIHCLDITGLYLNIETGEPIYSPNFYQLESQISLSGDILTNQSNRLLVAELNRKRIFAERGLDTCRDIADAVWDEFLRQAITEIYQSQQARVRQVKNECLTIVNNCYDTQRQSLRDFSNTDEQLLLAQQLELSEEMCREKLDACSNLYGGGPKGFAELLTAMKHITTQQIANDCITTLEKYAQELCIPSSNDSLHTYPYACRVYAPGEQKYANIEICNHLTKNELTIGSSGLTGPSTTPDHSNPMKPAYICKPEHRIYSSCKDNFYLHPESNDCIPCPDTCTCKDSKISDCPVISTVDYGECGPDYVGSLYHKMVRYAKQACVRPSENTYKLPATIMQDINIVMDKIHSDMAIVLSQECTRWGGVWIDSVWIDNQTDCTSLTDAASKETCISQNSLAAQGKAINSDKVHDYTGHTQNKKFYDETGANTKWGYCANDDDIYSPSFIPNNISTENSNNSNSNNNNNNNNPGNTTTPSLSPTKTITMVSDYSGAVSCCPDGISVPDTGIVLYCILDSTTQEYNNCTIRVKVYDQYRATCPSNEYCRIHGFRTANSEYVYYDDSPCGGDCYYHECTNEWSFDASKSSETSGNDLPAGSKLYPIWDKVDSIVCN